MATEPAPAPAAGTGEPATEARPEPAAAADVRVLVQEEGRAARNLLVFNVLVDNKSPSSVLRSARRQPAASPRAGRPGGHQEERPPARAAAAAAAARKRGRARSVSAGRGSAKDLHARYWTFLFENLRRAVDEIYQTCETDDSVLECKETIMILERCTQDFRNLIEWLKIKWEYDHTPKPQRPASVAWEIRKTSPGKVPLALVEKRLVGEHSRKQLTFDAEGRLSRPGSVSSGSARAEPDAAMGCYLEQALRSAMGSPETPGDGTHPPPPPSSALAGPQTAAEERQQGTSDRPARSPPPAQSTAPGPTSGNETGQETAQKPARARTAARARGGRTSTAAATSVGVTARTRSAVSPRGGGRGTGTRPASVSAAPGARTEQKTASRPGQTQSAGRGGSVSTSAGPGGRTERTGLGVRRPARGGASRPAGPPPVVRSATMGRASALASRPASASGAGRGGGGPTGLQRSATVCSSEQRPPPAQLYSSCIKSRSNSSLSSTASSSGHSWADRVRGVTAAPGAGAGSAAPAALAAPAAPAATASAAAATDDDDVGWETVKSRSRSRLSSLNQGQTRAPLQRKGSAEAACGGGGARMYSARARFHQPTSAISLPSLAPSSAAPVTDRPAERRPSGVSERAARRAAAAGRGGGAGPRTAPPPPPADSPALRRSRERVPTTAAATEGRGDAAGTAAAPARGQRQKAPAAETAAKSTTDVTSGKSAPPSDTPGHCSDVSASSSGTLEPTPSASNTTITGDTTITSTVPATTSGDAGVTNIAPDAAASDGGPVKAAPATTEGIGSAVLDTADSSNPTTDKSELPISIATTSTTEGLTSTTTSSNVMSTTTALSITIPGLPSTAPGAVAASSPRDPASSPALATPGDSAASPCARDQLTSPELDEDSVDEEMALAERALQSAIVEEQHLEQQLAETESCVIEVDTETDGDSTSVDTECEGDDGGPALPTSRSLIEDQYAPELENLSWGDRMDLLEELEDLSSRTPGRGLQMHEKLSSPSRKKALSETIRLHQERQQKASRMRRTLMDQKTQKLSEISTKIEVVRQKKEQLLEGKRLMLERKMARAEEQRRKHLQDIVRRAHDEEEKAKEIAFINELEAKNKRHEFYSQIQTQEARLAGIQEERQRRLEEKAAKEAAVEEKRRALEQERQVKLEELKQKRKERLERIHREQRDKEKERLEMAREKQRDRDERLSALHAANQASAEELQRRIQQKQEESARRHEENMVQIRQRALELSVRSAAAGGDDTTVQLAPYDTKKMCTLCNVLIGSEVYLLTHLRGRQHQEAVRAAAGADLAGEDLLLYNLRHITDAAPHQILNMSFDKERHKALRKRCKKIKARMVARQQEYARTSQPRPATVDAPHRDKLAKCVKELNKLAAGQGRGPWPNAAVSALDRTLGEMLRILDKGIASDQLSLCASGGLRALSDIVALIQDELARDVEIVPARTVSNVSRALAAACRHNPDNCLHMINSNMVGAALDLLMTRLTRLSTSCAASGGVRCDPGAAALMQLTSALLTALTGPDLSHQRWSLLQDVCSYLVCVGTVDKISSFFSCVQGGPDSEPHLADFLTQSLRLLRAMAALLAARHPQSTQSKEPLDRTGLVATLQVTQLCGVVSLLYGALLRHHSPTQRSSTPPPPLDQATVLLAAEALSALLQLAQLDLHMFQMCLGFEGRSVEFRHVTSYLLWYCSHHDQPSLLKLVIQTAGYFAARCYDNQMVLQKGNMPTVLQQLLTLPFAYFSDPTLMSVLFPTLLACCMDNAQTRAILDQELSFQILEDFLKQESSRSCHLVRVLLAVDEEGGSVRSGSVASSS